MTRYYIRFNGTGLKVFDDQTMQLSSRGFFCTRYTEAGSDDIAVIQAEKIVRADLAALTSEEEADSIKLEVYEVTELSCDPDIRPAGFTFYHDE